MIDWTETGVSVTADWWTLGLWVGLSLAIPFSGWVIWRAWRRQGRNTADLPALGFDLVTTWMGASLAGRLMLWAVLVVFGLLFVLAIGASFRLVFAVAFQPPEDGAASLGLGALLVALLGAPFLIWRSVVAQRTVDVAQDNFLLTQQGQVTQRINEAVEALGTVKIVADTERPNMEVRIGAILALGRIARENLDFHVQVMQILCAYIRENSKAADAEAVPEFFPPEPGPDGHADHEAWRNARENFQMELARCKAGLPAPRTDIQTALEVIGRRNTAQKRKEGGWPDPKAEADSLFDTVFPEPPAYPDADDPKALADWEKRIFGFGDEAEAARLGMAACTSYRLDLSAANLQGYQLFSLDLRGANLRGAQMQWANLREAEMQGADLRMAQMQGADLTEAQMQGADLSAVLMLGADLHGVNIQGSDLNETQMQGASVRYAEMQGANFNCTEMQGTDLRGAKMHGAFLNEAEMQGAVLVWAEMQGADLHGARMQGAYLLKAKIDHSTLVAEETFESAGVAQVDWSSANLSMRVVSEMFGDGSVKLPFENPAWWPKVKLGRKEWKIEFGHWRENSKTYNWEDRRQKYTTNGRMIPDNPPPEYKP